MHGGAITALADTALAIAIKTILPEGTHFATTKMELVFHAPVRWGALQACASVLDKKERDIVGEVELVTEDGVKAATFMATFRVKRDKI